MTDFNNATANSELKNKIYVRPAEKDDVRDIAEICVEDWKIAYKGIIGDDFLDSMNVEEAVSTVSVFTSGALRTMP